MNFRRLVLLTLVLAVSLTAEDAPSPPGRYRMFVRDLVRVAVQGESEMNVDRRIDGTGEINVPLLGQVKIAGLTTAEAQAMIAKRYADEEIYVRPEVVVSLLEYCPKEVMVLGQVNKQGKQVLPPEAVSISIVEAITSAGGLTRIAKGDAVRVTRKDENGGERSYTINIEKLIEGRAAPGDAFLLQPGDVVFVPERVF